MADGAKQRAFKSMHEIEKGEKVTVRFDDVSNGKGENFFFLELKDKLFLGYYIRSETLNYEDIIFVDMPGNVDCIKTFWDFGEGQGNDIVYERKSRTLSVKFSYKKDGEDLCVLYEHSCSLNDTGLLDIEYDEKSDQMVLSNLKNLKVTCTRKSVNKKADGAASQSPSLQEPLVNFIFGVYKLMGGFGDKDVDVTKYNCIVRAAALNHGKIQKPGVEPADEQVHFLIQQARDCAASV